MESGGHVLAVDVGGTKTLVGLVSRDGGVRADLEVATKDGAASSDDLGTVLAAIRRFVEGLPATSRPRALGAGFPEYVSPTGWVLSREVISWSEQPVTAIGALLSGLGHPEVRVSVDSDVRLGARGEAWLGAGRGLRSFLYVSLGTGLSSTLVIDSLPWAGEHGKAIAFGEWPAPPPIEGEVYCRSLEEFASGAGIARRYCSRAGVRLSTRQIAGLADPLAVETLRSAGEALGTSVAAFTRVVDPQAVVLGGGLGTGGGVLPFALKESYCAAGGTAPILPAALGSRSGLFGAAALALSPEAHGI